LRESEAERRAKHRLSQIVTWALAITTEIVGSCTKAILAFSFTALMLATVMLCPQRGNLAVNIVTTVGTIGVATKACGSCGGLIRQTATLVRKVTKAAAPTRRSTQTLIALVFAMLVTCTQADSGHQMDGGTGLYSVPAMIMPAASAAWEAYDCAGEWVQTLGEQDWEDLRQRHEDEEYWSQMGWTDAFYGDAMSDRASTTGLRVIAQNACKGLFKNEQSEAGTTRLSLLLARMTVDSVDIAIIHEPGMYRRTDGAIEALLGSAWKHLAVRRDRHDQGGGVLVIYKAPIEPAFDKGKTSGALQKWSDDLTNKGRRFESDRLVTMEMANPRLHHPVPNTPERKDRLMIVLMYGYNTAAKSPGQKNQWGEHELSQSTLVWETKKVIKEYKKQHPKASVILIGDLNCAEHAHVDSLAKGEDEEALGKTNHDADMGIKLPGHTLMASLRGMGLQDTFRQHHPYIRAVTRRPKGDQAGDSRRLDAIWTTSELTEAITTRIGIKAEDDVLASDHCMHYIDVHLDIANQAVNRQVTWSKTKETKITPIRELTNKHPMVQEFRDRLLAWEPDLHLQDRIKNLAQQEDASDSEWDKAMNDEFAMINSVLIEAGKGTILESKTVTSPNFVSKIPDMAASDWKHFLRRRRLRALLDALTRGLEGLEVERRLGRVPEPVDITKPQGEKVRQTEGSSLLQLWESSPSKLLEVVKEDTKQLNAWLDEEARRQRNTDSYARRKDTVREFNCGKVRRTVKAVFKTSRALKEKIWLLDKQGKLVNGSAAVAAYVAEFLTNWMATKAVITTRFKSMDAVLDWDLEGMPDEFRASVADHYESGGKDRHYYAAREHLWEGALDPVAEEDLAAAIQSCTPGKATGPSQIPIEVFKWMPEAPRQRIRQFLSECIRRRRFPPKANAAKMWLIPKIEAGMTDLAFTRPIALMETLCKIYERILCTRITNIMMKNEMIDRCQHGSIPEGTTDDAMFNLAAVLDDARESGQSLYLLSLDLSKAFDSLEYWSQALTWRAFGMPKDLVTILLQMDETATTQVALGGGRYTDPVPHERGVRQGSCGGPLKWVAFMHWWMTGVKSKMAGKGYKMSGDPTTEFTTQMFVDDSNWITSGSAAMQEMVTLLERWVLLHGLAINKGKTDLLTVNPEEEEEPIIWGDGTPLVSVHGTRPTRYLGAYYQTDGGWEGQAEVLQATLKSSLQDVSNNSRGMSIAQIRYCINSVILPRLLHPLKAAAPDMETLRSLDSQIRTTFYTTAGISGKDTPIEMTHVPIHQGGWGIHSVEMQHHARCIGMWMKALNQKPTHLSRRLADALLTTYKEQHGISGNPLRDEPLKKATSGSQLWNLRNALRELDLEATTTDHELCNPKGAHKYFRKKPTIPGIVETAELDIAQAQRVPVRGHVRAFTDGSLDNPTRLLPKCGWGYHLDWSTDSESAFGRVRSEPTIYEAESEAVLRALLAISPLDQAEIFIDNMSVLDQLISEIQSPWQHSQATTLDTPARSTWMRIRQLVDHRRTLGTTTTASWVHSHADDPDRQEVKCTTHRCACHRDSLPDATKCNPAHWTHRGNHKADRAADHGSETVGPGEGWRAEVRVFPVERGSHVTGKKLGDVLESAVNNALFRRARLKDKHRAARLEARNAATDPELRTRLAKKTTSSWRNVSERFATRAAMDILPTYVTLARRMHGSPDNSTRKQYTPEGDTEPIVDQHGTCPLCGQAPETMWHVLEECTACPKMALFRQNRLNADLATVAQHGLDHWWHQQNWSCESQEWNPLWASLGQVPKDAWATAAEHGADEKATRSCLAGIQDNAITTARELWERRNELVQDGERTAGVQSTKAEFKDYRPAKKQGARRRGRPCKPFEDLAPTTKMVRLRQADKEELEEEQPDEGPDRTALQKALKRARLLNKRREELGPLGNLATPGEGVDPTAKGNEHRKPHVTKHTRRAEKIGVGSRIGVSWPGPKGKRAATWRGTVTAMTPNANGTWDHVIAYDGNETEDSGRQYRHALWAGHTTYACPLEGAREMDRSTVCQQGQQDCHCGGRPPHDHPWYEKDSHLRTSCNCASCLSPEDAIDAIISRATPAGDELPKGKNYHMKQARAPPKERGRKRPNTGENITLSQPLLNKKGKSQLLPLTSKEEKSLRDELKAASDAQRDARRAARAGRRRHSDGTADIPDDQIGPGEEAAQDSHGSGRRDNGCPPEDAAIGAAGDHEPSGEEQEPMVELGDEPGVGSPGRRAESKDLADNARAGQAAPVSAIGAPAVQEAAREGRRRPKRPHGGHQGPPPDHGTQSGAPYGPEGEQTAKPVLRGPEHTGSGGPIRTQGHARGYRKRVQARRWRRPGSSHHAQEHRPVGSTGKQNAVMAGKKRTIRHEGGGGDRSWDAVPHLDETGRDAQEVGTELQTGGEGHAKPQKPREGSSGEGRDITGEGDRKHPADVALPGRVQRNSAAHLDGVGSLEQAGRAGLYEADATTAKDIVLHVQGQDGRRPAVPSAEAHEHMDHTQGLGAAHLQPSGRPLSSDRRTIAAKAEAEGHVDLGIEKMDSRRAHLGPPPPGTKRPANISRAVTGEVGSSDSRQNKSAKCRNKNPSSRTVQRKARKRRKEYTPEEVAQIMAESKKRRQEGTKLQNMITEEASAVHGQGLRDRGGRAEGRVEVGLGIVMPQGEHREGEEEEDDQEGDEMEADE